MIKKLKQMAFSRLGIVGIMILLQFALIVLAAIEFTRYFIVYYTVMLVFEIIFMLKIIDTDQNMAYKLAWIVIIFLFPAFGIPVYMIFCGNRVSERLRAKMRFMNDYIKSELPERMAVAKLGEEDSAAAKQSTYIRNASLCPLYVNEGTTYYSSGEEMFEPFLEELKKAEKYIFIEYFIIARGEMWDRIHEILLRKAKDGVDVRVIYDDIGCIMTLERKFAAKLKKEGIDCRVFHRFTPVLSSHQNNRDHRKICVIDGKVAFTGGINLSDEYINRIARFGYWKDNAIRVVGDAAWSFTVMFLTMWDYLGGTRRAEGNYDFYKPTLSNKNEVTNGYIQPYTDNPLDYEPVGENIYLGVIEAAEKYVWIMTPYLILDERMVLALCKAAKSGVDVRIITPGIPDKKIINETTKSFYPYLIRHGVKVYEFTPGFLHSKTFVCDDKYATVGSVNLDYRSLYLHFECGVWMYKTNSVMEVKEDFCRTFLQCEEIQKPKNSLFRRLFRGILELFAPLM